MFLFLFSGSNGAIENVQLFTMPCNTADLSDIKAWQRSHGRETPEQPAVQLTLQWQKSKSKVTVYFIMNLKFKTVLKIVAYGNNNRRIPAHNV